MRAPTDVFGLCGNVIDGQFHVLEVIGEGGFSVVYRGQHLGLREPVAIKCLKLGKTRDAAIIASFTQRFFDESRISYRLSQGNLNIVRSVTAGTTLSPQTGQTVPYMVLEWLEGISLTADLRARREQKMTGRTLREVIDLFEPTASALAYAHSQGIAHRDVKPGNLFLAHTADGIRLKVLDFGMAKVLDVPAVGFEGAATIGNLMVISPQYSAPEQFEAKHGTVGAWTDVYSLALVLVEVLTDRRARQSESFAELLISVGDPRKQPTPRAQGARVSDALEALFVSALSIDPQGRPRDVAELWSRLKAIAQAEAADESTNRDMLKPDFQRTLAMPQELPAHVQQFLKGPVPAGKAALSGTIPMALPAAAQPLPKTTLLMPQGAQARQMEAARAMAIAETQRPEQQQQPQPAWSAPQPAANPRPQPAWQPEAAAPPPPYTQPAEPKKGGGTTVLVLVIALVLLGGLGAGGYVAYGKYKARAALATAAPTATPTPSASTALPVPVPTPTPADTASAAPSATASTTSPTVTASAPTSGTATHRPSAPPDPKVAREASANAALAVVDGILSSCKRADGPTGKGTARVTFNNDGSVSQVVVDKAPYTGTPTAICIASRYRTAKMAGFDGEPVSVEHPFDIPK